MQPSPHCNEIIHKQILDKLDLAILIVDQDEAIIDSNKTACELYGYSTKELCTLHLKDLLAPNVSQLSSPLSFKNPTTWHCNKNGFPFCVEILAQPIQSSSNNNLSMVSIRNVSLSHLSEQQHQRDRQIYKAVVESSPLLIARFLPDSTITFANLAFCSYFGHTKKSFIGKKLYDFPPEQETKEFIINHFKTFANNPQTRTHDTIIIAKSGQPRWIQFTESPIFDSSGNLHEIQSVGVDIHEQNLTRE